MAFILYSIVCTVFIVVCLGLLWPINAASERVKRQNRQLQRELELNLAPAHDE